MRAALLLLGAALMTIVAASIVLAFEVNEYLANPRAISSSSGLTVVRDENGLLVSYEPFQAGPSLTLIGIGIVAAAAAVLIAAIVWRRRVAPD